MKILKALLARMSKTYSPTPEQLEALAKIKFPCC